MQTFGKLQAKLFPKYFALLSAACVICMGTIAFSPGALLPKSQAISLGMLAHPTWCTAATQVEPLSAGSIDLSAKLHPISGRQLSCYTLHVYFPKLRKHMDAFGKPYSRRLLWVFQTPESLQWMTLACCWEQWQLPRISLSTHDMLQV